LNTKTLPEFLKKTIPACLVLFLFFSAICPLVSADGMSFMGDPDMMLLQAEHDQTGAIFYEQGYENLLLSVSLDWSQRGNQSIWIFPVPAQPQDIRIDVLKGFPTYDGTSVSDRYARQIGTVALVSASCATFPLTTPYVLIGLVGSSHFLGGFASAPPTVADGVIVYEQLDKAGLRTELVTAKNASALAGYLSGRGLVLPEGSLEMLDDYIENDYSFVITSVLDVTEYRKQFPARSSGISGHVFRDSGSDEVVGVFVRFPTDHIYFPLKPTRAYGDREIPLLLTINGHVTPRLSENIRSHALVDYLTQDSYTPPARLENFFNHHQELVPCHYTKIMISGPAGNYTDDLWIETGTPPDISARLWMIQYYPLIGIGLYALLSAVAALLAGLIVFRRGSVSPGQLLRHGLWNCATLIGFVYATRRVLVLPEDETKKRGRFVAVFVTVFLVLVMTVALVLESSFIQLVMIFPLVIFFIVLIGSWEVAAMIFSGCTGHAVYLPNDRMFIWSLALIIIALLIAFLLCAGRMMVRYLNEP